MPPYKNFRGSHTVLATPFTADGSSVDVDALRRLVDWQIESGSHGLIPLGSTGEFLSVSDAERTQVVETVVEAADGRVPVLIGTADEWTDKAIRYSLEAQAIGADGMMIISPYYSSPTEDELFEHFRRISDAVSIPIMVYNNPNTANVDLRPEFVARLGALENVRYIKESSGDISRVREIHRISDKVSVFAGYHPFESLAAGAKGYVSVIGNFLPAESAAVCDLMDAGRRDNALRLYNRLIPLLNAIAGDKYVSATKCAMAAVGMPIGDPRPPRLALPEDEAARLHKIIEEFKAESKAMDATQAAD
jgi:4-hydroxy-tetrahydrodipicolinate synthase